MIRARYLMNNCKNSLARLPHLRTMIKAKSSDDNQPCEKGILIQTLNPMTGQRDWKMVSEDYDYQQEVARAAFADMLHDSERNHLYYVGLKAAIAKKRSEGEEVHVLDIGTGTGLLAMMAARIGADSVTAIEEFRPMADIAERIMAKNGFSDKITLIRKRSTEVRIGTEMARRANILVTEVFDTELIGEGAIATFNLAHKHLLTDDCLVVPCEGRVYAQVVESDLIQRWNVLRAIQLSDDKNDDILNVDAKSNSSSSLALHDLQLSQFKPEWFKPITEPLQVFKFNFGAQLGQPIPVNEQTVVRSKSIASGRCDAVFMWWDIDMDPDKKVRLSCAPKWAHPNPNDLPWRDHWMQAVYYPIRSPDVDSGQEISLISNHDEYSLWFDVETKQIDSFPQIPMPMPTGGIHLAVSRPRLGQINDPTRNQKMIRAFKKVVANFVKENNRLPNCLCLSELTMLPIVAAAELSFAAKNISDEVKRAANIYVSERNVQMKSVLQNCVAQNGDRVQNRIVFLQNSDIASLEPIHFEDKIDVIFGEPHFALNFLPWHNLLFWFAANKFLESSPETILMPKCAKLWALPVHYKDLWKIRAPVQIVEGFDLSHFDQVVMSACDKSDANVEPHPLWEYPCEAVGQPQCLMTFDLTRPVPNEKVSSCCEFQVQANEHLLNGMALWMDWHLTDDPEDVLSSGPCEPVVIGRNVTWDLHSRQGVYFFKSEERTFFENAKSIFSKILFKPEEGDFEFKFERRF